ncbi:MAG: hypothetical protein ACKOXK_09845 [Chakrabartia sp.]
MFWLMLLGVLFALNAHFTPRLLSLIPVAGFGFAAFGMASWWRAGRPDLAFACFFGAALFLMIAWAVDRRFRQTRRAA